MIRNVLFDVDGTLFSSEAIIHEVYRQEFERWRAEFGRPKHTPTLDAIVAQIGRPVPEIFAALTPELPREEQEALALRILENLVARVLGGQGEHYVGAADVVRAFFRRGLRLFTVSNGRVAYIEAVLLAAGVRTCFEAVPHLEGMAASSKQELAGRVLERFGLLAPETVLVGDRASDRDAALAHGITFLACSYGHGSATEWDGATWIADRPAQLVGYVATLSEPAR